MAIVYTYLNEKNAHGTDSDPLKTTKIYNAFDNETGVSKRIEILAATAEEDIQAALEAAYNESQCPNEYLDANGNNIVSHVYDKLNAELLRNSATELQLGQRSGTSGIVQVNGTAANLSTPKTLTLGTSIANLIEGGSPSASTLYNIYLSSSGVLGLSATAPLANGYRTGDATNRFFGAVYIDASKECASDLYLAGYGISVYRYVPAFNIVKTSGASDFFDMYDYDNIPVLPGLVSANNCLSVNTGGTVLNVTDYLYDETTAETLADASGRQDNSTGGRVRVPVLTEFQVTSTIKLVRFYSRVYYTTGSTLTIYGGTSYKTRLNITRVAM